MRSLVLSLVSAEEELLISNTILIGISLYSQHNVSAIAPMISVAKFHFPVSSHQCLLPLQLSFIFCECLGWQNSAVWDFSTTKYFQIIYFLFFTISFAIYCHDSQYLAPTVVINRYCTPRLNEIFGCYFLVFGKCGVTAHRLYGGSLTLIRQVNQKSIIYLPLFFK